jgi:aryl-alcohol dehydrogenase-like predicted oxidoreductase
LQTDYLDLYQLHLARTKKQLLWSTRGFKVQDDAEDNIHAVLQT